MRIDTLKMDMLDSFKKYCVKHRAQIDESFLYDYDLEKFEVGKENPTYIVTDDSLNIVAAASLIIDDYSRQGRKARFRIFHSEIDDEKLYDMLFKAILKHIDGLDKVYIFIPIVNKELINQIEKLNFTVERYSFFLIREKADVNSFTLPEGYELKPFVSGKDEQVWCDIRNVSFAKLKGSETPITPERVEKMLQEDGYIKDGMMILYHKDKPVGVIKGERDEYENQPLMNIGPIAIIPEYQGRGLGRIMLRAMLKFAEENSFEKACLCVNAENERAKALYVSEGFKEAESVVCYEYKLEYRINEAESVLKEKLAAIEKRNYIMENDNEYMETAIQMMEHIGSLDPELRDDLIYTIFSHWILEDRFTSEQLAELLNISLDKEHLFYKIEENDQDSVFKRTFSALVIALIIYQHRKENFLTESMLEKTKNSLLQYMAAEKDLRGYVDIKGWAHSAAHTSDALDEIVQCSFIKKSDIEAVLNVIKEKVFVGSYVYIEEEPERMVNAVESALNRKMLTSAEVAKWLQGFDVGQSDASGVERMHLKVNVKNFLRSLYFRLLDKDDSKDIVEDIKLTLKGIR